MVAVVVTGLSAEVRLPWVTRVAGRDVYAAELDLPREAELKVSLRGVRNETYGEGGVQDNSAPFSLPGLDGTARRLTYDGATHTLTVSPPLGDLSTARAVWLTPSVIDTGCTEPVKSWRPRVDRDYPR